MTHVENAIIYVLIIRHSVAWSEM